MIPQPDVQVRSNVRFVDTGKSSPQLEFPLALTVRCNVVERSIGREAATRTARGMEYNWDATREPDEPEIP